MNVSRFFRITLLAVVGSWLAVGSAAAGKTNLVAKARTVAPAGVTTTRVEELVMVAPFVTPELPESAFVMPKDKSVGRDPFFPKSVRPYVGDAPVDNKKLPTQPVAELALKGISGSKEQPLAIINTTTFTTGEENDVMTKVGRIRIRCVEINMDDGTVTVQVGGVRQVLRLNAK